MNWLAHLYLSPPSTEFRLGNLLADLLKNQRWEGMTQDMLAGIRCHQEIDAFTDTHQVVKRSKARLEGDGHLRGIVMDVVYDHLLTLNWRKFSSQNLRDYLDSFYQDARKVCVSYPVKPKIFITSLWKSDRLNRYGDMNGVESALERIDSRLSERVKQRGRLVDFMPSISSCVGELEEDFLEFFPELIQHVEEWK